MAEFWPIATAHECSLDSSQFEPVDSSLKYETHQRDALDLMQGHTFGGLLETLCTSQYKEFFTRRTNNQRRLCSTLPSVPRSLDPTLNPGRSGLRTPDNCRLLFSAITIAIPALCQISPLSSQLNEDLVVRDIMEDELKFCGFLAIVLGFRCAETNTQEDVNAWFATMHALARILEPSIEQNGWTDGALVANVAFGSYVDDYMTSSDNDDALGLFNSPMETYFLDRCSRLTFGASTHVSEALHEVNRLGAGALFKSDFDREIIQRLDLGAASKALRRPILAEPQYQRDVERNTTYTASSGQQAHRPMKDLGGGVSLADILDDLRLCCRIFEAEIAGCEDSDARQAAQRDCVLVRQRVQYRLLCTEQTAGIAEVARLAVLVYSYGVTYPLADNRPLKTLAGRLGSALDAVLLSSYSSRSPDLQDATSSLILWATVLGAIAGYPRMRYDYGVRLQLLSSKLQIYFWSEVRPFMKTYVWLDAACEEAGRRVWMEALGQEEDAEGPIGL